jgi:transposase
VSQISPPVRILLVGAVAFLAAWFTVLRPKTDAAIAPAATPAATATATPKPTDAFGKAVAKAKHAVAQSNAASRRAGGETATHKTQAETQAATTTTQAVAGDTVIPVKVLDTLPTEISQALQANRTIVLGVIADGQTRLRPLADDDRYVRNALNKVNRYDGQVVVRRVTTDELVQFAPLVGDLHIDQTPSIVVIDGKLQGTVLSGYVDRISINQAIADARRNSISPLIADPYLRKLNTACSQWVTAEDRWSYPTIPGQKALASSMNRRIALEHRYRSLVARIAAPARWRSLKSQFVSALDSYDASIARQANAVRTGDNAAYLSATASFDVGRFRKLDTRLDKLGVTSCVADRRS